MSLCSRPVANCPECGDDLIHQSNRQEHESSSAFGQYVHDRGEREKAWREMFWLDVDGAIYKERTKILRIIEHKPTGGGLSKSQRTVLPLLAKAIQLLCATGLLHRQSGVFAVWSDHPHDVLRVQQVAGWAARWKSKEPFDLKGQQRDDFLRGEVITPERPSADDMFDVYGEEFET